MTKTKRGDAGGGKPAPEFYLFLFENNRLSPQGD